jgi:hypothetical protein
MEHADYENRVRCDIQHISTGHKTNQYNITYVTPLLYRLKTGAVQCEHVELGLVLLSGHCWYKTSAHRNSNQNVHKKVDDGMRLRLWTTAINGPFVHPQVIHEHGEPWWMMSTGKNSRFIHQIALRQSYQHSHLAAKLEDLGEGNDGF